MELEDSVALRRAEECQPWRNAIVGSTRVARRSRLGKGVPTPQGSVIGAAAARVARLDGSLDVHCTSYGEVRDERDRLSSASIAR